jgi:ribonucleoside-diphosphate reductase beta chain
VVGCERGGGRGHASRPRTEREDFQATSDPALQESADRGEIRLLDERFDDDERFQRMYGLASFFVGEQRFTMW